VNGALRGHALVADELEDLMTFWVVPLFALATLALWFFDRPGPWYRWKIACLSGLSAAAVGLLVAQVVSHLWVRERPFVAHPHDTLLLVPPSHDPSFPSDHAVAAFAIAFSVAFVGGRRVGAAFLAAASVIALGRVLIGVHYPGDVAGGALIGLLSALIVFFTAGGRWVPLVRALSTITDPVARLAWKAKDAPGARRRLRSLVG
jgi:undecaprenyl-diphosphatase